METVRTAHAGRWTAVRTVFRNPVLARPLRGLFAFSITVKGAWLALLLFAFNQNGVAEAGWLALFLLVPAALIAPVLAFTVDTLPGHRILTVGYGLVAVSALATGAAMLSDAPIAVIYSLALVFSILRTFARPATAAIIPLAATTPDELTAVNTAAGTIETTGRLMGPALAGVILVSSSPGAVITWLGALMALGAVATIGPRPGAAEVCSRHADDPARGSAFVELTAGLRLLRDDAQVRTLVGAVATTSWIVGALDVGAAALAIGVLQRDDAAVSVLITGFGVGALLGSAASFALVGRRRLARALAASVLLMCMAFGLVGWSNHLTAATFLLVLVGAGVTLTSVAGRTMLQGLTPDDTLARLFGMLEALEMLCLAAGGMVLAVLVVHTSLSTAVLVVGGSAVVGLAVMWRRLVSIDRARRATDPALLRLGRSSAVLRPLPPYAIEQLMHDLVRQSFEQGSVLMSKGEIGERLCLIAEGDVDVHLDDEIVTRRTPGTVIGEISVIRDVRRTATVTAGRNGAVVYWMRGEAFLDAVNRAPRSRARVEAEAGRRLNH